MTHDFSLYVQIYFISILGGFIAVQTLLSIIRRRTGQKDERKPLDIWLGGTERAVATTLVIWAPGYVAAFIGAWVAIKLAANWQRLGNSKAARTGTLIALIGNVFSFAIAIGAGIYLNQDALAVWSGKQDKCQACISAPAAIGR